MSVALQVTLPSTATYTVDALHSDTIGEVRAKIAALCELQPAKFMLTFEGDRLEDCARVGGYPFEDLSTVNVEPSSSEKRRMRLEELRWDPKDTDIDLLLKLQKLCKHKAFEQADSLDARYSKVVEVLADEADDLFEDILVYAAWLGMLECVAVIMGNIDIDINKRTLTSVSDRAGSWTPLHAAAANNHLKLVEYFLAHCADPNIPCLLGTLAVCSPIHEAACGNLVELAHLLLSHGAHLDARDDKGRTPLHLASRHGHVSVMTVFLEQASAQDIDAKDTQCKTPLHHAAGNADIARLLLDHGADCDALDIYRSTPLHEAATGDHFSTLSLLLGYGADPGIRDRYNLLAIDHAAYHNFKEVAALLRVKTGTCRQNWCVIC